MLSTATPTSLAGGVAPLEVKQNSWPPNRLARKMGTEEQTAVDGCDSKAVNGDSPQARLVGHEGDETARKHHQAASVVGEEETGPPESE